MNAGPSIALTVDVEEQQHGLRIAGEDPFFSQDVAWLLDLFAAQRVQATFFVLGEVARNHPDLVARIAEEGHEIGLHGVVHEFLRDLGPDEFEQGVSNFVPLVSSLANQPILGFRAPFFSVTKDTPWCFEILKKHGFQYDSSIYPGPNDRYGWPGAPSMPAVHQPSGIKLFPVPILHPLMPIAFSGGAYLRILPWWLVDQGLRSQLKNRQPGMVYLHPWESAKMLPWQGSAGFRPNITRHFRRHRMRPRLQQILGKYGRFMGPMRDVLAAHKNFSVWTGASHR